MKIEQATRRWWSALKAVSVLNVVLLFWTLAMAPRELPYSGAHLWCTTLFTVICAFRSFYPRVDLERTVMVDHWMSGIALGRAAATVAEMAFAIQCALIVEVLADVTKIESMHLVSLAIVPTIALAQVACWTAVLTLNHFWHAVEEILWTCMVVFLAVVLAASWTHLQNWPQWLLPIGIAGCIASAFVMTYLDVPMYFARSRQHRAEGGKFLSLRVGLADAFTRREPTGSWVVWGDEVAWMTPYFSGAVWLSQIMAWIEL